MAKQIDKQSLFDDYFHTLTEVMHTFERVFVVENVWSKVLGAKDSEKYGFSSATSEQAAKDHVRASGAWQALSDLYDYAVDGIAGNNDCTDIVIGGAEVLSFVTTENCTPSEEWDRIVRQADGRNALDLGESITLDKLAYLAGVDTRTVRNAISAGELIAQKSESGLLIENASARSWLKGRRGFKPTVLFSKAIGNLAQVSTPAEFGAFMTARRAQIGRDNEVKIVPFHPGLDVRAVEEIENGVFRLPLDTVFPLADFYQLDRGQLLACVMRVFFREQLSSLREAFQAK